MELRDYLTVLRKYWVSVVAITLLGVLGAGAVSLLTKPTFTAGSAVFLTVQGGASAGELLQGANYAANQVRSYAQVATTPEVLQPVIDQLGLDLTPSKLASQVTTTIPTNTAIIEVAVVDRDPALAAAIAQAVVERLVSTAESLSPTDATGARSVRASIITPATVPTEWTSPRVGLNLALGLLIGLLVGVGQAVLRNSLDLSVTDEDDVARATDHSVIAKVPFEADAADHPLVMLSDPHSLRAEEYRRLRTNLQFLSVDGNGALVVTSSIPGEGKTTTAINLATTLAEGGDRVLLIDADLRRPQVATYLGIEGAVGLTTALVKRAALADVLQPVGDSGLHVLASGQVPPNPAELLGSEAMKRLLAEACAQYDTVVIDAPPLLPVTDAAILASITRGALLVTGSGMATIPQLQDALDTVEQAQAATLGIVLNKVRATTNGGYHYYYSRERVTAGSRRSLRNRSTGPAGRRTLVSAAVE